MRIELFGIPVDNLSRDEIIRHFDKMVSPTNSTQQCCYADLNVSKLVVARKTKAIYYSLKNSDIVVSDGQPIVWISWLFGSPLRERIAGCDFFQELISHGSKNGIKYFLLGAKKDVVVKVKTVFEDKNPGVNIVGYRDGYFNEAEEPDVVNAINSSGAQVLFIGISSPKQEEFIHRNKDNLKSVRWIQGVGGSFDVVAGIVTRAPVWMQKAGLEWLYRLLQEPRRMLRRYFITNSVFIWLVIRELIRIRYRILFKKTT